MPRYRVRHMALGRIAEHDLQADSSAHVSSALAAQLKVAVSPADILQAVAMAGAPEAKLQVARSGHVAPGVAGRSFPRRLFCQELAVLLDGGIPLLESLDALREKEASVDVAAVLTGLSEALKQGLTLAQGMRVYPQAFGQLLVASVDASSRTGHTASALRQHAAYLAWVEALRGQLLRALIYPAILVSASLLVMGFLTVFVVPRFADIYEGMGGQLPWLSGLLLALGKWVGAHTWWVLAGLLGLGAGAVMAWRSPVLRAALAARAWALPGIGSRLRLVELATLYRTLGLLLQAGVPVLAALEASGPLVSPALGRALASACGRVREGARLSDSLEQQALTTPVSLRMIRVGEHSGELGPMLERAAAFYDEEIARFTDWVGRVISPVLMLIMGVLIGGIVVLMYLPIFQVAEQIQ